MVPAMTLLGVGEEAAILRGYGPIDPATAAQLTAEATSWRRILTDPITGRILATDPRDYRPTAAMIDHARLVHPECVFPGCTVPSEQADMDHTEDHAYGGGTIPENLAPLSPGHHRAKHHTRWQFVQNGDDTLTATSPAGHVYTVRPEGRMKPAPRATHHSSRHHGSSRTPTTTQRRTSTTAPSNDHRTTRVSIRPQAERGTSAPYRYQPKPLLDRSHKRGTRFSAPEQEHPAERVPERTEARRPAATAPGRAIRGARVPGLCMVRRVSRPRWASSW